MREEEHSSEVYTKNKQVSTFQERRGGGTSSPGRSFSSFWGCSIGCRIIFSPNIFLSNTSLVNPSVITQIYLHDSFSEDKSVG